MYQKDGKGEKVLRMLRFQHPFYLDFSENYVIFVVRKYCNMKLTKDERKMFATLFEKAINFPDKIGEKRNIPLLKEQGEVKTIGDAMDVVIMSLHMIGEAIVGQEV